MLDAVVIGAGHAGLAASSRLSAAGLSHVVLERGQIGDSWRTQRWDSFTLNTPNRLNRLPGAAPGSDDPDAFEGRDAWVARLERYVRDQRLPVREHAAVTAVDPDGDAFRVTVARGDALRARNVIVASGMVNAPKVPAAAAGLDPRIDRLTTGTYRSPAQLAEGAALVVGSAQSGCQIAEDLLEAGRDVLLATGRVGRAPRRLRGRDTIVWWTESGWLDQRPADLADPGLMRMAQPQISGVGPRGHTVSLQSLAARGVRLLGRLIGIEGHRVSFAADLPEHVRFGDERSAAIHQHVDDHIARLGLDAPPTEPDPADDPAPDPAAFVAPTQIDLRASGITTVIFTTGFNTDLLWLHVPVVDERGEPRHDEGRAPIDGVWFLGWMWLRKRQSGIIWGADEDSAHVVDQVVARARAGASAAG